MEWSNGNAFEIVRMSDMGTETSGADFDVVVIGGGPAGLNAALVLGRARWRVMLVDAGQGRNATAREAHNIFTRDGTPPAELRRIGQEQLQPYGVDVRRGTVTGASIRDGAFSVALDEGGELTTRKLLLATGVVDELPPLEGLAERWGTSVFNCPFCHGWEVRAEPVVAYGQGTVGFELARLLRGWSADVALCTDGPTGLTAEERAHLTALGIPIREEPIARLDGAGSALERIVFADGATLPCHAILMRPPRRQRSSLAVELGCAFTDAGLVQVHEWGQTSVPGVCAAGDMASEVAMVVAAAAAGAKAGAAITKELLEEHEQRVLSRSGAPGDRRVPATA